MISILISTYGDEEWEQRGVALAQLTGNNNRDADVFPWHEPEGTITSARNGAVTHAIGDWLCFLDADDQLDADFVPFMGKAILRDPGNHLRLLTPAVLQVRGGRRNGPLFFPQCSLETGNWLIIGTLIHKTLFHQIGGFREHPHGLEDWNLWRRAVRSGAQIIRVKRAVYIAHYNHHSKHHQIRRNHKAYVAAYEAARDDI